MHFEASEYRKKMFGSSRRQKDTSLEAEVKMTNDMVKWLHSGGQVAVYDTKNNTREQRKATVNRIQKQFEVFQMPVKDTYTILWIESFCEDLEKVEKLFLSSNTKKYSAKQDLNDALLDFRAFLAETDKDYETLDASSPEMKEVSFIKLINFGETMVTHRVKGYIESKLASFCVNVHTETRYVFLVRHGETIYNVEDRLGGDSDLTEKGEKFAVDLARYMWKLFPDKNGTEFTWTPRKKTFNKQNTTAENLQVAEDVVKKLKKNDGTATSVFGKNGNEKRRSSVTEDPSPLGTTDDLIVYTSNMKRAVHSGKHIHALKKVKWSSLVEIDAGVCEGMTYKEMKTQMFAEFSARQRDKLNWRYPQGESYVDVKKRLEPVIFEIERERRNLLIIGHRAVLRCLYAYFVDIEESETPFLPFPLHTVVVLQAKLDSLHGWEVEENRLVLSPGLSNNS